MDLKIRYLKEIGDHVLDSFTAALPTLDSSGQQREVPKYAQIVAGAKRKYVRIIPQRGANGDIITVGDAALLDSSATIVTLRAATQRAYRLHRLLRDPSLRLGVLGLVATVVGLSMDASFAICKVLPIITV